MRSVDTWSPDEVVVSWAAGGLTHAARLGADPTLEGVPAPEGWAEWLEALFPEHVTHEFGARHVEFWEWVWAIEAPTSPRAFVAVWPRGGGKTTSAELAAAALGVRGRRRYAWYVNETQDKADKNVENVGALLESEAVERHYPGHAQRKVGKYGDSRGWRRARLRTAGDFTIDALGLDTAARGLKVEYQRPDLIILDDVDDKHDAPATTAKKIRTITTSILPAGASNVAVLAVQNLIIPDGVFTRLSDGRADFLTDRQVSGPHPAIEGLKHEWRKHAKSGLKRAVIVAGKATWSGQSLEVCQTTMDRIGLQAFLKECQHLVKELAEGVALAYDATQHHQAWTDDEIRKAIKEQKLVPFAGVDFGLWRFAYLLMAADRAGRVHVLDELFSQREELSARARLIHEMNERYGIDPVKLRIWGDSANPTDIMEINAALKRGWTVGGLKIVSRCHVSPVAMANKARVTSVERLNDMLGRVALLFRRGLGQGHDWMLGHNSTHAGEPMVGSRLLWEIGSWSFPGPRDGAAQKQDPDDDTADGADMIAALRYAIMSWWRGPAVPKAKPRANHNRDAGLDRLVERIAKRAQYDPRRRTAS